MSLHKEINLEAEICDHLAAHGWLYSPGDAARHDRARALFPDDVVAWVQATQPKAWEGIVKNHGSQAAETLLNRLRESLDKRGTLDVLRHGIEILGLRGKLLLAQFKPALAMNPDILARYHHQYEHQQHHDHADPLRRGRVRIHKCRRRLGADELLLRRQRGVLLPGSS